MAQEEKAYFRFENRKNTSLVVLCFKEMNTDMTELSGHAFSSFVATLKQDLRWKSMTRLCSCEIQTCTQELTKVRCHLWMSWTQAIKLVVLNKWVTAQKRVDVDLKAHKKHWKSNPCMLFWAGTDQRHQFARKQGCEIARDCCCDVFKMHTLGWILI